eukprot:10413.XXX_481422_481571_1 [CDS] Oithona nana genome sequencing.
MTGMAIMSKNSPMDSWLTTWGMVAKSASGWYTSASFFKGKMTESSSKMI